jgi:hypothetical protein
MIRHHIFSIENVLRDLKDYILPYTEEVPIRMQVIVQNMLDEVCFVQGNLSFDEYSMAVGEECALNELLDYDIPPVMCRSTIANIKVAMLAPLIPLLNGEDAYRLSHTQLNEYEYCISIYYYKAKRFKIRPQETCYATTIPNHWAQSID